MSSLVNVEDIVPIVTVPPTFLAFTVLIYALPSPIVPTPAPPVFLECTLVSINTTVSVGIEIVSKVVNVALVVLTVAPVTSLVTLVVGSILTSPPTCKVLTGAAAILIPNLTFVLSQNKLLLF
jgi:hypothetical protein